MPSIIGMQAGHVAILLGVGLLVCLLVSRLRRSFPSSSRSTVGIGERPKWDARVQEHARGLEGEIDAKMRALERLIQTAGEATVRLDAAIERAEQVGVIVEQRHAKSASRTAKPDEQPVGASAKRAENKPMRRPVPQSALVGAGAGVAQNVDDDPRFERVYALADAGFTAVKIAGQIGAQVGEVELIMSLRRR